MIESRHPVARVTLVMALVISLFSLSPAKAHAATTARIILKPNTGPPGVPFTVKGQGFGSEVTVLISFDKTFAGSAVTSPDGTFTTEVTGFPGAKTPGKHLVVASAAPERAQATYLIRTDWARYHFDNANTGWNPYENVLFPTNVGALVQKWAMPTAAGAAPDPIVAYGKVYVAPADGIVRALDRTTGSVLWSSDTGGTMTGTAPTAANNLIYVGNDNGELFALSASTGQVRWSRDLGLDIVGSPLVGSGAVFVGAFNPAPTYEGMYKLDPLTGATIWFSDVSIAGDHPPTLAYGKVFDEAGLTCRLQALDSDTGSEDWLLGFCDEGFNSQAVPAAKGTVVDVSTAVHGVDAATGTVLWTTNALGSPASIADGVVFVAGSELDALDLSTGSLLWDTPLSGLILSSPAIANDVVYLGLGDGTIRAFDTSTGSQLWTSPVAPSHFDANPAISDGVLYSATADGTVYAFGLP